MDTSRKAPKTRPGISISAVPLIPKRLKATTPMSGPAATPTVPSLNEPIQFLYCWGMVTLPPWLQAPVQAA